MRLNRILFMVAGIVLALIAITTAATALTVAGISPSTVYRVEGTVSATVYGTGFEPGATVYLWNNWPGEPGEVPVYTETVTSSGTITCTLYISEYEAPDYFTLSVYNPGMTTPVSLENAFRLTTEPVTPAQKVDDLASIIDRLGLRHGLEEALTGKLTNVITELDTGDETAAINILNAFIRQVRTQSGRGIPVAQASALIAEALAIIANLRL